MQPRVLSVNAGPRQRLAGVRGPTAIAKSPVDRIEVREPGPKHGGLGSGVICDEIGHPKHHGGSTQAVYAFAREELDWWAAHLGRDLPDAMFGENLTTIGYDVDASLIGEQWRVGTAVLAVAGPRIPCHTFAVRMGEKGWIKRFAARERVGAYLRVVEPGVIAAGDLIEVVDRPRHGFTVPDVFRAAMGDREVALAVLDAGILPPAEQEWLAGRLA